MTLGILQENFNNSTVVCSSDKNLTRQVNKYTKNCVMMPLFHLLYFIFVIFQLFHGADGIRIIQEFRSDVAQDITQANLKDVLKPQTIGECKKGECDASYNCWSGTTVPCISYDHEPFLHTYMYTCSTYMQLSSSRLQALLLLILLRSIANIGLFLQILVSFCNTTQ